MSTSLSPTKAPHLCLSLSPDACWHFGSSAPPIPVPPTPHPPLPPPPPPLDASRRPSQCGTPSAAARPSNPSTPPLPANSTPPPTPADSSYPQSPSASAARRIEQEAFAQITSPPDAPARKKRMLGKVCVCMCVWWRRQGPYRQSSQAFTSLGK